MGSQLGSLLTVELCIEFMQTHNGYPEQEQWHDWAGVPGGGVAGGLGGAAALTLTNVTWDVY